MKRKIISLCLFLFTIVFTVGVTACNVWELEEKRITASVVKTEENLLIIEVESAQEGVTLIDVMEYLQTENALTFTVDGTGMVSGINGKANPADWSSCWMLYTSDAEMANDAWGTYEYEGQTFGSAILGAESLSVIDGGVYVWAYQGF